MQTDYDDQSQINHQSLSQLYFYVLFAERSLRSNYANPQNDDEPKRSHIMFAFFW